MLLYFSYFSIFTPNTVSFKQSFNKIYIYFLFIFQYPFLSEPTLVIVPFSRSVLMIRLIFLVLTFKVSDNFFAVIDGSLLSTAKILFSSSLAMLGTVFDTENGI